MVLTQRWGAKPFLQPCLEVSIPLWFLRNKPFKNSSYYLEFRVSIPLWFLRNETHSDPCHYLLDRFPYHYGSYATNNLYKLGRWFSLVSIPLWFLRNVTSRGSSNRFPNVSIPLWFLRNKQHGHQTRIITKVSIPLWFLRNFKQRAWHQYASAVSIPLWFLRNSAKLTSTYQTLFGFHTTMVLTQRIPLGRL